MWVSALQQFVGVAGGGKAQSTEITPGFNPQLRSKDKSEVHGECWQCRGGRLLCVNPLCAPVPPHSALWPRPPGPARSDNNQKNTVKLFVLDVKRIRHGGPEASDARGTDRTANDVPKRKKEKYHHDGKTPFFLFFFPATRHTFRSTSVEKRVRRSQPARQDVGLLSRKERGTTSSWGKKKKIPGISARSRGYPDSCNSSKLDYGPQMTCLAASTPTSALTTAEEPRRSRVIAPPHRCALLRTQLTMLSRQEVTFRLLKDTLEHTPITPPCTWVYILKPPPLNISPLCFTIWITWAFPAWPACNMFFLPNDLNYKTKDKSFITNESSY